MKRFWPLLPLTAVLLLAVGLSASDQPGKPKNLVGSDEALIALKLASTQKTLEGLVEKNFQMIRKAGEELKRLDESRLWSDVDNPEYTHYRIELTRQADKLIQLADAKNLDGAAFTYMNMVGTCINCHTHCRDVLKIAGLQDDLGKLPLSAVSK